MEIINKFDTEMRSIFGKKLKALILYGSHAYGTNDEFSDIDICVVIDNYNDDDSEKIKNTTDVFNGEKYFILAVNSEEFQKIIKSGDYFYRDEIVGKGKIIYEHDEYIKNAILEPIDTKMSESINSDRYKNDINGLEFNIHGTLERIQWCFMDIIQLKLAKEGKTPIGLEEMASIALIPELRFQNKELAEYIDDFMKVFKLNKDYQHKKIDFPFDELSYFYNKLNNLEKDVGL